MTTHGKNDLALHVLAFIALSLPLLALWPRLMTMICLAGLAAVVEIAQLWIPRRNQAWMTSSPAWWVYYWAQRFFSPWRARPEHALGW